MIKVGARNISLILNRMLIFCLFLSSCETEIEINASEDSIPVVYFIFNYSAQSFDVKLTKTYAGHEDAFRMAKIADSVYFKNARVFLESWQNDYLQGMIELFPNNSYEKEPGIFVENPNIIYSHVRSFDDPFFGYNNLRLVIDIPETNTIAYSEFSPISFQKIKPKEIPNKRNVDIYREDPYQLMWATDAFYCEIKIGFHYLEYKYGIEEEKYIEWGIGITTPDIGSKFGLNLKKSYKLYLNELNFYPKIAGRIKSDPNVTTRRFKSIDLIYFCADQNFYDYLHTYNAPSMDQAGKVYSNIVNGMGLCASTNQKVFSDYTLRFVELDSLSKGQYTKHLKFKRY